jgi:predicted ATPase
MDRPRWWGLPPKAIHTFKRALVQDAAYQSLLESQRQELHGRIAADVNRELGRTEDALSTLEVALGIEEETDARLIRAWLYLLKGETLLQQRALGEAESCFRRALEVAREQEGRSWELQATTSLARLLRDRGERDEARALLAPVYDWFTEGFDTADLKDAKALLEEMA